MTNRRSPLAPAAPAIFLALAVLFLGAPSWGGIGGQPPVAVCQDIQITLPGTLPTCLSYTITPADVDGGSFDPDGDSLIYAVFPNNFSAPGTFAALLTVTDPFGASSSCTAAVEVLSCPSAVEIDIKPGSDLNPINTFGKGVIPVAILGSDSFDVRDVAPDTLAFGPDGAFLAHRKGPHFADVNDDGFEDLLAHFRTQETGLEWNVDIGACLTWESYDGIPFEACDDIVTPPACGIGFELALLLPPLMWLRHRRRRAPH